MFLQISACLQCCQVVRIRTHLCACVCVFESVCTFIQTDLHPLELLVGGKGSCRDTFNQVLLQTTERESKERREGGEKKTELDNL